MSMTNSQIVDCAIEGLEFRIRQLQQQLDQLRGDRLEQQRVTLTGRPQDVRQMQIKKLPELMQEKPQAKARNMSPEGRAAIAAATKARWAAFRAAKAEKAPVKVTRKKGKAA